MTDMILIQQVINILLATFVAISALGLGILITLMCEYYIFK
jgi:hypothetical protein